MFKRPKRIDFYKKIPLETLPTTFHSITRNKRRSFAMLAGIFLAMALLSGILLYNNELKVNQYESIVGDFPFEVRFDIVGDESDSSLKELSNQLLKDDRVLDTTIVATVNSNTRNNWLEAILFSDNDLEKVQPTGHNTWPYFVQDDFFANDSLIAETIINMDFKGSTNLTGNSIILSEQLARDMAIDIGDVIRDVNLTQIIYGDVNDFKRGSLSNLTLIGTYDAVGLDDEIVVSENPFYGQIIYMNYDLLFHPNMTQLETSMRNTGNFYVATKLDVSKFSVSDPATFSKEIDRFINQIAKNSGKDIVGTNEIEDTLILFSIYSVFISILYVVLALPVIILSIYLLNFGLEMSLEERRRLISIKKVQGANSKQIFAELRNDTLLLLILGSVLGYMGGIFSAWIISSATGFMNIQIGNFNSLVNYIRFDLSSYLIPLSMISVLLIAVTYKKGRSFIETAVTDGVTRRELKKMSFYKKNKIDVLLFILSLSGVALVITKQLKIKTNLSIFMEVLIFIFTPFMFWIGGASVGSRVVKIVPLKLEGTFLKLQVFRDVKRIIKSGLKRRGDIDRLALIIILTLSIAALATIQGNTEEFQAASNIEWKVGADWQVTFNNPGVYHSNISDINGLSDSIGINSMQVRSLSSSITVVAYENHKEYQNMKDRDPVLKWQDNNFNTHTPVDALKALEDNPNGIFVTSDHLFSLDANIGDLIEIKISLANSTTYESKSINNIGILGTVSHLPGGISNAMMISEDLMQRFNALQLGLDENTFIGKNMNSSTYFALSDNGDNISDKEIDQIKNIIDNIDTISSQLSFEKEIREINTNSNGFGISGLLSLNFIISLIASIVSAFSFSAILMERRRQEFAILRAIGAKKSHIYKLALGENSLMMLTASIWGIFIGIGISYLFNGVFEFVSFFVNTAGLADRTVVLPVAELVVICLITLFGMLGATLLSIRSAANQDLSSATKVV